MPRKQAAKARSTGKRKAARPPASHQPLEEGAEAEIAATSCLVAGFGASAGGLEAFTEVLQDLPDDTGLAIVFIQHLDPKHSSVLTELLSRSTRMAVSQIVSGMRVAPNRVYVIPPNADISIRQGELTVQPRPPAGPHMPIDHFFRSLAQDQGSKAIGVVLSGTASDGTLGLKAIKAEGGITFAQEPESAKYDGMPRSAIVAGCVDTVLPPGAIATELARLCRHPYLRRPRPVEGAPEGEKDFDDIFALLRSATGVEFTYYKPGTIRRRTARRMALHKLETPGEYLRYLKEHRPELDLLFQDILINVTGFFREPGAFRGIQSLVLPAILKNRGPDPVRVWVPGCATGEEAYSVAICLLEHMRLTGSEVPVQIFGTDLSEAALEKARAGVYPASIAADVSPERLQEFFVRTNGAYQIARSVRDVCIFARQNVTKDPPFSRLDLITCRNLLIYLGPVLQGKVMRMFHYALKPGGFLVLGASESVGAAGDLFSTVDQQSKIYTRKPVPSTLAADFGAYEGADTPRPAERTEAGGSPVEGHRRVDQMILARFSPPAVVVDRELRVLEFRGRTPPYLEHVPGEASLNLMKMTQGGLGMEIRKLVHKADLKGAPVKSDPISVSLDGEVRIVAASVTPVRGVAPAQFLVVFEDLPHAPEAKPVKVPSAGKNPASGGRVRALELELLNTRQYLQSVIEEQEAATEELKSAHEEVQSSNEELQSTNEELLTAKEELQSTNEELTTLNEEMQSRNIELQQVNNDLFNLLSSVNIPIVMLGNDLRIRRFTPQAERILSLIPADVSRPISDFRLKINVPDLGAVCQEVTDSLAPREREVQDTDGRHYSMWVRPYRTSDNRIDGVVLTFFDITERKQGAEARYRRLFEAAKDGLVIADATTGEIVDVNPFVTRLLGYPRMRLVGARFWESALFAGSEIDESLRGEFKDRESVVKTVPLPAESGEQVEVEIVASLYAEGERTVIQFSIRDIRARRRMEEKQRRGEEQTRQAHKMEAVGRLAGGVAHDFNNILTAILGYTELLLQDLEEDHPGRDMLGNIRVAAERAVGLTRQLLAFGRKQIVSPVVLDVNEVITEARQMVYVMLPADIELVMALDPGTGRARADRTQIEQVVLNLALNARDAMPDGGTITVATADADVDEAFASAHPAVPAGRYVAITVKDTGTGMSEDTQTHLFEPFFTTKPKDGGVGLGLATVHNIVKQSGGYIWAYSELGAGSTFTVYLPRVEPVDAVAESAPPRLEEAGGTETILIVEKEPAIRVLARRFLEPYGYRIIEAPNGPEAVRVARQFDGPIHLMLTDVVMPRMSGRELAFQLAPERPAMRVLYMSGHTEDAIIHHGVLEDRVAFLQKPFSQSGLAARVRHILDRDEPAQAEAKKN
jgi:two-component system CheB/CheR fusion protein